MYLGSAFFYPTHFAKVQALFGALGYPASGRTGATACGRILLQKSVEIGGEP
jgi:hypothetical protein